MLQAMHNKAASWIAKILAVLLIISFGAWGITDYLTPGAGRSDVAEVGDSSITANEFNEQFRRSMERMRSVLGANLDSQQARQLGLADTTLDDLVTRRLLRLESQELGLLIGDAVIRAEIMKEPAFRNSAGQFDQAIFNQVLAQSGMSESRYVAGLRSQIARDNLTGVIEAGSVAPGAMVDTLYRYQNEKRTAEVVIVPRDASRKPAAPGEAALRAYHKKEAARFTAPELRDITAIHLDPASYADGMAPSEERIRNEFENRLSSLTVPERRKLRQIVVQSRKDAEKAAKRLAAGAKFEALSKELGKDARSVDLGLVTFQELPVELAGAAFKLKKNETADPIKTPLGWHVVQVTEIHPGRTPKLSDVRETIRRDLALEQARDALVDVSNRLADALAGGATLEQAASEVGTRVIKVKSVDMRGRNAGGKPVPGLPKVPNFLAMAFDAEQGQVSDVEEVGDGGYVVVRVDRVIAPKLRPFETVRKDVAAAWQIAQQDKAARKRAKAILDKVRAGATLKKAAAGTGLTVSATKPFTRFSREAGSKLPAELATKLFDLRVGQAEMAPSDSGYAVARLVGVQPADPVQNKERVEQVADTLSRAIAGDLLAQFSGALRDRFPVTINRRALDSLFDDTVR